MVCERRRTGSEADAKGNEGTPASPTGTRNFDLRHSFSKHPAPFSRTPDSPEKGPSAQNRYCVRSTVSWLSEEAPQSKSITESQRAKRS